MPKTVLFLDLDGVAHPAEAASAMPNRTVYGEDLFRWIEALLLLLSDFPHVQVVVHSAWRHVYPDEASLRAALPPALEARVVGVTPLDVFDRQTSIEEYCRREGVERFVAIDDTEVQFDEGLPWLVVAGAEGLSDPKTVQALREALEPRRSNAVTLAAIADAKAGKVTDASLEDFDFDPPKAVVNPKPADLSDEDKVVQFTALLDAPLAPNPGLERLLAVNPPWTTGED